MTTKDVASQMMAAITSHSQNAAKTGYDYREADRKIAKANMAAAEEKLMEALETFKQMILSEAAAS